MWNARGSRTGAVALGLSWVTVLSGCTVDLVGVGATNASPSVASTRPTPATEESDDPLQYARRSYWVDQVTVTTACPTGEIVVSGEDQTVQLTEDCQRVVVRASDTNVIALAVGTLVIEEDADYGYVLVKSAQSIDIKGDYATVYWDQGNPGVTMSGDSEANPNPVKE